MCTAPLPLSQLPPIDSLQLSDGEKKRHGRQDYDHDYGLRSLLFSLQDVATSQLQSGDVLEWTVCGRNQPSRL